MAVQVMEQTETERGRPFTVHHLKPRSVMTRMRRFAPRGQDALADWSINPYRGCQHACTYCYARRTHVAFDMDGGADFERHIFVKEDAAAVLRDQLRRHRGPWERPLVIGTAVDPYQPVEGQQRITRAILEVLADYHVPVQIITKNTMIIRDTDLLQRLATTGYCAVFISVTTLDEGLARQMEPATPPPLKRLRAIQHLAAHGIPAGMMLAPILPWLTDQPGRIEALAEAAMAHQAHWLTSGSLRLHPDVRPIFMRWLEQAYPELVARYDRWYAGASAPQQYRDRLHARVAGVREQLGLADGPPVYQPTYPQQLSLWPA